MVARSPITLPRLAHFLMCLYGYVCRYVASLARFIGLLCEFLESARVPSGRGPPSTESSLQRVLS